MKHENLWMMWAVAGATAAVMGGAATAGPIQQQSPTTTIVGERPVEQGMSVQVSYRDLNLTAATDERVLYRRVGGAARFVCQPNDSDIGDQSFAECVSSAWKGARPQMALAVQRAREIAYKGTSGIPLVAIAVVGVR